MTRTELAAEPFYKPSFLAPSLERFPLALTAFFELIASKAAAKEELGLGVKSCLEQMT